MVQGNNEKEVILEARNLRKDFGRKAAVAGVQFSLSRRDFVGLLGPNGAGKTTTIKMMNGLMKPTGGEVFYYGKKFSLVPGEVKKYIGVVPQQSNVDRDLTAYENLYLHALIHGIPKKERGPRIGESLEFAGLQDYRDKQVKTFSGGMLRRLVIVRALLHDPKIVFLDEPTVGLDPQIRRNIWDLIIRVNQRRDAAILLTTHYIEEAERLCSRVLIIDNGKIISEGAPEELKRGMGGFVLEVYRDEGIEESFFESKEEALDRLKECRHTCKIREVSLEDVFLRLTGRRINV
ncbi:MAG: ABC transporter ATP-binding protein [bacterium]